MRTPDKPCGEFAVKIGRRIRWIREIQDLSLAALSERSGITGKTIQKYERGHNPIDCNSLDAIAAGLNVSPTRLCGALADFAWLVQEQVAQIEAPNVLISKDPDVKKSA